MSADQSQDLPTPRLHELLSPDDINELYNTFKSTDPYRRGKLRELLADYSIKYTDDQFENLFLKINTNRDDLCDWDEFVSHLLLGFKGDDPYGQKETLILPIEGPPDVRKSLHKYPIVRVRYNPTVLADRSLNWSSGNYVTASKDGTLIYWSQSFEYQRSSKSKSPTLKIAKTWVLDFICLPDVRVLCTSSIERELRFYDTTASNFNLRIVISSFPYAINTMHYWFGETTDVDCKIVLGDFAGNVMLLEFCPELRGPFQSKTSSLLTKITWKQLLAGKLPAMKVTVFNNIHTDIVRQVDYCETLHAVVSCAESRDIPVGKTPAPGLVISDLGIQKYQTILRMSKGVTCFAFDRASEIFATGGPDCVLRLWNHIVPKKPVAILPGHHSGIIYVFIQDNGKKCYSIDKQKVVKVWDIIEQSNIQTYIGIYNAVPDRTTINCVYNDCNREFVIASLRIALVKCCPLLNLDLSDGTTHSRPISVLLYNDLFKVIVTCGHDCYIIVWNPFTGQRLKLIKEAHTRLVHGEIKKVEITAGCFDPKEQLLLTGARDGTLKIWNFNAGICIRNMSIEYMCEVTSAYWLKDRILVVGWNKHVVEFMDSEENEHGKGRHWDTVHLEDILVACAREPNTYATGSYSGELVFWNLETAQPFRRHNVDNPGARIKIIYEGQKAIVVKSSKFSITSHKSMKFWQNAIVGDNEMENRRKRISLVQLPTKSAASKTVAIYRMLFLQTRPQSPEYASLVVAIDIGMIQMYSHHRLGGYMESFNAIHTAGDCVVALYTDIDNHYLFTGTAQGYIKVWLIVNYCIPKEKQITVSMPKLRIMFPFLTRDRWEGKAKRTAGKNGSPMLINSYKAHLNAITNLVYVNDTRLLISSSVDYTVRIWTLSGKYIGTLGSPLKWEPLSLTKLIDEDTYKFRIPPDLLRVASSTTLKVFKGAAAEDQLTLLIQKHRKENETEETVSKESLNTYGQPLKEPILGNHTDMPDFEGTTIMPTLDKTCGHIPIYKHLNYHKPDPIETPRTPELMKICKKLPIN